MATDLDGIGMEIEIPESYKQLSEEELNEDTKKKVFRFFECCRCKCVIENRDVNQDPKSPLMPGCIVHPDCRCNTNIFFHRSWE